MTSSLADMSCPDVTVLLFIQYFVSPQDVGITQNIIFNYTSAPERPAVDSNASQMTFAVSHK